MSFTVFLAVSASTTRGATWATKRVNSSMFSANKLAFSTLATSNPQSRGPKSTMEDNASTLTNRRGYRAVGSDSMNDPILKLRGGVGNANRYFSSTSSATSASNKAEKESESYYTIAVTGSSGMVANAFLNELSSSKQGKLFNKPVQILRLVRDSSPPSSSFHYDNLTVEDVLWNPHASDASEIVPSEKLENVNAVVNLAGETIATGTGKLGFLGIRPWSEAKKQIMFNSRIPGTRALASFLAQQSSEVTYLSASAIGVYGYDFFEGSKDDSADESYNVENTKGYLAELGRQWEEAAVVKQEQKNKVRTVNLRFGVVLSKRGGVLGKLLPIYKLGGGGVVGSGKQYFSFISARDAARALVHCLETSELQGPVNLVSPRPCTNEAFTKAMGRVLRRWTIFPMPAFVAKLLFGEMGEETLLGGAKVVPTNLLDSGFGFQHETVEDAIQSAIGEEHI